MSLSPAISILLSVVEDEGLSVWSSLSLVSEAAA